MSWSYQIGPVKAEEFSAAADAALEAHRSEGDLNNHAAAEAADQKEQATSAAKSIVSSLAVVHAGQYVRASLSGHANPGHEKLSGYANDVINVSVAQMDAPEPAPSN